MISFKNLNPCYDDTQILLSSYVYLRKLTQAALVRFCVCGNLRVAMDAVGTLCML